MNRRWLMIAGLGLLAGCAASGAPVLHPAQAAHPELERLYAARAGREALVIEVASNGCTAKPDFAFYVERAGEAATLSFARKRLDPCRSFAMGKTELSFTWAELGLDPRRPVFLLNPLAAWTGPGA
ncbi:hypothetical protein [Phenylobacterium sp.]|uniref:hypothetical protein n=1 Tax=Phenylobacterium sp. TaxID=1871053 RepID=UPI0035ADEF90